MTRVVHWTTPYDVLYIGRPSRWGNPYRMGPGQTRADVIEAYRAYLAARPDLIARARADLKPKFPLP